MGNLNASQTRSNLGFYWGPDQQARLIAMAAAGHTGAEIAALFGTSRSAILGRAWRTSVKLNGRGGRRRRPLKSVSAVVTSVRPLGRPPKPRSVRLEAVALHLAGFSLADVAVRLGHSVDSVWRWRRDGDLREQARLIMARVEVQRRTAA